MGFPGISKRIYILGVPLRRQKPWVNMTSMDFKWDLPLRLWFLSGKYHCLKNGFETLSMDRDGEDMYMGISGEYRGIMWAPNRRIL